MFWGKKNSNDTKTKNKKSDKRSGKETSCVGRKEGQRLSREEIQAQALANSRLARENIGEETLERIAAAMTKKQQSAVEQSKLQIKSADDGRVMDELKFMLRDK